ncbi:hypothetical protein PHMEG_00020245 [Phytophthora megakarya]|uniref:Uncharacterized protein n=1 Tax=Phytophthora megakarya TaxID=4795 RepID=A0A225VPU7_9STRA|nr:hypothetical protein PHMEG_00020245 [Phytophthora megakarya]
MPSLSSDQYEVMNTLRSEMFKNDDFPKFGRFNTPGGFDRSDFTRTDRATSRMDLTPAERDVFMKYRQKGKQTAAVGGLVGASAMAGVWKVAALRRGVGIAGMLVGGMVGAGVAMRSSGIRREMVTDMLKLPSEESSRASKAREMYVVHWVDSLGLFCFG